MLKDSRLDQLAATRNVAQFVSFGPDPIAVRHSRLRDASELLNEEPETCIEALLRRSLAGSVNVRSFLPGREKGCPFEYGLTTVPAVMATLRRLAADGYFTIVNETIDVNDGGVSGVTMGGIAEFTPDDTPRGVEKSGVASLPQQISVQLLAMVYGFIPDIDGGQDQRLEWSIHPNRVGTLRSHTLAWESEAVGPISLVADHRWPNRFSEHIGDKAYGLAVAHLLGARVPHTTVIGRRVAPFTFGTPSGTGDWWLRTCPRVQAPGQFSTTSTWVDPYSLLSREDPHGESIVSVISQEAVDARWSGATLPHANPKLATVEGVPGSGQAFMLGDQPPVPLPTLVVDSVRSMTGSLTLHLRTPVRAEWAHDGQTAWLLQLHQAQVATNAAGTIYPGEASEWIEFRVSDGLEVLRSLLPTAHARGAGVLVVGEVGLTSHVGDLIRKARVPGRLRNT